MNKTNKGFGLVGVLIAVGIVAILGGGYYISKDNGTVPEDNFGLILDDTQDIVEQAEGDNQKVIIDETVDWKTYKNEEFGFEFKYPDSGDISYEGPTRIRDLEEFFTEIDIINPKISLFISEEDFFSWADFKLVDFSYISDDRKYNGKLEFHLNHQSAKLDSVYISLKVVDINNNRITLRKDISIEEMDSLEDLKNYLKENGRDDFAVDINLLYKLLDTFKFIE